MRIPGHFDASIGLESISVKGLEPHQKIPDRSFVGSKEAVSLALTTTFPTFQLQLMLMESFLPAFATKGLFKDHLRKLLELFAAEEGEEFKKTEFFSLLAEDCERHEKVMEERQKHVGP